MPGKDAPVERQHKEIHRVKIEAPMAAQPYEFSGLAKPHFFDGTRIQVNAFISEHGEIVERWQFSDTDVRWYRLEVYQEKRIVLKVAKRANLR
jgi:hypothetical protein